MTKTFYSAARFGAVLVALNLAYQAFIWFTGMNSAQSAFLPFLLFLPALIVIGMLAERRRGGSALKLVLTGAVISIIASVCIVAMMFLFLDVIGGGILPPFLVAQRDALANQIAHSENVSEHALGQFRALNSLTPMKFAIWAGIQNAILGFVESVILGGMVALFIKRRTASRH